MYNIFMLVSPPCFAHTPAEDNTAKLHVQAYTQNIYASRIV